MTTLILVSLLGLAAPQEQERPTVPKDSIELVVLGCLKGRVLRAGDRREVDVVSGPNVTGRSFRLAGPREVMDEVKKHNGHYVEVGGIVKRSALDDKGVEAGRVRIGGGSPVAGSGGIPSPAADVVVMDATSVRLRSTECPIKGS